MQAAPWLRPRLLDQPAFSGRKELEFPNAENPLRVPPRPYVVSLPGTSSPIVHGVKRNRDWWCVHIVIKLTDGLEMLQPNMVQSSSRTRRVQGRHTRSPAKNGKRSTSIRGWGRGLCSLNDIDPKASANASCSTPVESCRAVRSPFRLCPVRFCKRGLLSRPMIGSFVSTAKISSSAGYLKSSRNAVLRHKPE